MKRVLIVGLGVAFGSAALAQSPAPPPVSVYPGTSVRVAGTPRVTPTTVLAPADTPVPAPTPAPAPAPAAPAVTAAGRADPLQPLGGLLSMPLPTSPTVAAGTCASGSCAPACGSPLFSTLARDGAGKPRPCLDRVVNWLTWHPGPSVLPVLVPTPYQTPLRDYFACTPLKNPGYPAAATCASPAGAGPRLAAALGLGSVATGCADGASKPRVSCATAFGCQPVAPVVIPLPPVFASPAERHGGRCAMDRLMGLLGCGTCRAETANTSCATTPSVGVPNAATTPAGYYYATPPSHQAAR